MNHYILGLTWGEDEMAENFECEVADPIHAREKADNAYPNCKIWSVKLA